MQKYCFETSTLLNLILTCPSSKVRLDDLIVSNDCHHQYLRVKWPRNYIISLVARHSNMPCDLANMCRTTCLWLLFYSGLLWPDLDLDIFKHAVGSHAVSLVDIYPALWVSVSYLLPVQPNREPKMLQRFARTFDLTLTLHMTLLLNC